MILVMEFTEEQIKDVLNLKDQISTQIEQHKVTVLKRILLRNNVFNVFVRNFFESLNLF